MNKVMVVKNFALRGFNDVRQNPQKYSKVYIQA